MAPALRTPPLIVAAKAGDIEALTALVAAGTNVNTTDSDGSGNTPLHWSAFWGRTAACKFLLEHGANVNGTSADMATALHMSAAAGHIEVVSVLLNSQANCDVVDDLGRTPLTKALMLGAAQQHEESGHAAVVVALLGRGAAVDPAMVGQGRSIHWLAAAAQNAPALVALLSQPAVAKEVDLERRDKAGRSALMVAAIAGAAECTEALVQAGANLETVDRAGATAYLGACYGGSQSCQKLLLLAGSKKDAVDKFGNDATAYLSHMLSREEKANSLGDFDGNSTPAKERVHMAGVLSMCCCLGEDGDGGRRRNTVSPEEGLSTPLEAASSTTP